MAKEIFRQEGRDEQGFFGRMFAKDGDICHDKLL